MFFSAEKLLNIRTEATAVKAQIDAELSAGKTATPKTPEPKPAAKVSVPLQTQSYHPTIDVSKYRTDIFCQSSASELSAENKTDAANEDNDSQYHLKCYKQKCTELEKQGKLLETHLWISFPITVICIFVFIFFFSKKIKNPRNSQV